MCPAPVAGDERKALGAYYTAETVARFLVDWGLSTGAQSVMDPSCGDGRFLGAAADQGAKRIVGCDISQDAIDDTAQRLGETETDPELITSDFFFVEPAEVEPVDLIVGNPPFIRYQRFSGESRRRALASALRMGAQLTQLTSSWAPFLLHAVQFLRPGGSLGMVVPAEITQTKYGLVALRALLRSFSSITLIAFEQNLYFEHAQEETCLLLATGKGGSCEDVRLVPLVSMEGLRDTNLTDTSPPAGVRVQVGDDSFVRFAAALLSAEERAAWEQVKRRELVRPIGSLTTVVNGYVTGDNRFFHRSLDETGADGYPSTWFYPVARSSRSLKGLEFTKVDIVALEKEGTPHHLLIPQDDLFDSDGEALQRLIQEGEQQRVNERFKCRTRSPWWRVPGIQQADVLVAYMIGSYPRACLNRAGAFYANSLHGLRVNADLPAELLAVSFYSSLTLLSLEIEGRTYGGGILKLEPRELDRALVALPQIGEPHLHSLCDAVDGMLRAGEYGTAVATVDRELLAAGLGTDEETIAHLASARERLMTRRLRRSQGSRSGASS
jgi:adenine-specific DNA methylase